MHLDPSEAINFFNAVRIRHALHYLYILVIHIFGGGCIPNGDSQQCWVKLLWYPSLRVIRNGALVPPNCHTQHVFMV